MNRELHRLIRTLESLTPEEVTRVRQFTARLRSGAPSTATGTEGRDVSAAEFADEPFDGTPPGSGAREGDPALEDDDAAWDAIDCCTDEADQDASGADDNPDHPSDEADGCRTGSSGDDPSALWRRRPFQAIDEDDLQPIAALFREAIDSRAAARQRFGSR